VNVRCPSRNSGQIPNHLMTSARPARQVQAPGQAQLPPRMGFSTLVRALVHGVEYSHRATHGRRLGTQMIKVGIVEDDPGYRLGLKTIVESQADIQPLVVSRSVEEFEAQQVFGLDVALLDLGLRGDGLEGADAVRRLVEVEVKVLVVSMAHQEVPVVEAIRAGAYGYLTKESEPEEIIRAVRTVASGGTHFSPTVAGYLLRDQRRMTEREVEILALVANGERASDIAGQLFISVSTVNGHLENIRHKTGYRNKADLTRLAFEKGILPRRRRK
jgi:DNA-binding NarL/FixJ family response regulator